MEGNPSDWLALRTAVQVMNPDVDKLSCEAYPILQNHLGEISGTFLDVGCYGGWVYPAVRDKADYYGIDNWPSAIEAGRKMFGNRFEVADLFDYEKKHDVVWCSQLLFGFEERTKMAWEKCRSLSNRLCIFFSPQVNARFDGITEFYQRGRMGVAIWRNG